jgi:spermidine synthase
VRIAILSVILFLSGSSALIFQTLWLRLSGLAFGNSVWSAALILSSFMAGLALGSAIAASSKLRRVRALHFYALLELIVAILGCTLVFAIPVLGEKLHFIFQALWSDHVLLNGLRFWLSFLILLVPTTAMGLTLPVLLEDPILRHYDFGRTIGLLYGWNTLGAVVGALVSEIYLVKAFGLWGTGLAAGLISCAASAIAVLVARLTRNSAGLTAKRAGQVRQQTDYRRPWRLLFVTFGTGGILLCLEVVWFRFLRLYVASSPTAFCVMLAVVLAGIGLGGIAGGVIYRHMVSPQKLLPIVFITAALATLLSYLFFPIPALQGNPGAYDVRLWNQISLLSLELMFPIAFLSGILFPFITACVQTRVEDPMNCAGLTTLFNTSGAAAGPLLASFVLIPNIGFQWSLVLCAAGYAFLAVMASERTNWSLRRPLGASFLGLCLVLLVIVTVFPYRRDEAHFANARRPYEVDGSHLIEKIEGNSDTLQLLQCDLFGEPYYYRLVTNGYSMSSTHPRSQRYMRLFAYLPLVFNPTAKDALLICYGVGVTADALVHASQLQHIDIVDISKEVFALADRYSGFGYSNPLRDPRVTSFVQDGRFFLQVSPRQYDVITGEPPPLKVAGTVNLYTEQFFSLMNEKLKEGGVATFWLPIYQLDVAETKAILRAFHNVFPNTSVWASSDLEWIMMGIKGPGRELKEQEVRRLWSDPGTKKDLTRIGVEVPEQIAALFVMDSEEVDRIALGIKPLTDFYPRRLSDSLPDLEATHRFAWTYMDAPAAARNCRSSSLMNRIWPQRLRMSLEPFFLIRATRYLSAITGSNWLAELEIYLRGSQLRAPVLDVLDSDEVRLAIAAKQTAQSQSVRSAEIPDLVAGALARRDISGAIELLELEKNRGFRDTNQLFLLIYLYCLDSQVSKAEELAAAKAESIPNDWFTEWTWGTLQAEFGFRPPR